MGRHRSISLAGAVWIPYNEPVRMNVPYEHVYTAKVISMKAEPARELELFPNPNPDRDYEIRMECPEFTCLCPRTGQPDFAEIHIRYVPAESCIELKSLKLYLWSYRNEGAFHEAVINKILDDLSGACKPRFMEVKGDFYVRGGIHTTVTATVGKNP
jgi:7-cyano-7-deazaguanine reductase